jgi:hypothetical protein
MFDGSNIGDRVRSGDVGGVVNVGSEGGGGKSVLGSKGDGGADVREGGLSNKGGRSELEKRGESNGGRLLCR